MQGGDRWLRPGDFRGWESGWERGSRCSRRRSACSARPPRPPRRRRPRSSSSTAPPDATIDAGVAAIEALGAANGFEVDRPTTRPTSPRPTSSSTARSCSSTTTATRLNAAQETALQGYVQDGGGFVGIGGAAEAEPASTLLRRPDRRPARRRQPDGHQRAGRRRRRPRAPGDQDAPARVDAQRRLVPVDRRGRPARSTPSPATTRPNAPAGDGTDIGGTDWPISWCRDFQGGRSFYTGMGRTAASYAEANFRTHLLGAIQWSAGPRPRRLQGDDRRQLHGRAARRRLERQPRATPASRTASRSRPTAGRSTSAAPTAAPTPSAAR